MTLFPITSKLLLLTPAEKMDFLAISILEQLHIWSAFSQLHHIPSLPSFKLCFLHLIHGVIYKLNQC